MAASIAGVLSNNLQEKINQCKLLVVGAGGIGCELLKDLVLTGFVNIDIVDLDTIDVSNLNRQFLFRKEHVGKSKARVAKESALQFNPSAKIEAYHDSVMNTEYGVEFFKKYDMVMNALDNRAARNHVNRMCLASDRPLIESGSAGYLGQVTVIKKGLTECYECQPTQPQKTFPGCTIRNTPSEPIHCIVWAKHLFNQLFGEDDPDQNVSPDTEDPEAAAAAGESALQAEAKEGVAGGIERKSTRGWAQDSGYDANKLFNKLFRDDVKYLLSMENLWKKRRPPTPLEWDDLPCTDEGIEAGIQDQRVWGVKECVTAFANSMTILKADLTQEGEGGMLVWDKDDEAAMNFVTAVSNIRAFIFGIRLKSKFDIKSMAGNIIPAIATTNAIIAGLIVMESFKILLGQTDQCKTVYLNRHPNPRKKLLLPCQLDPPNPKCYVCSEKPEVTVRLNTETTTVKTLEDKILKTALGMVAPDVEIDDGKGTILISSEEGETEDNWGRMLNEFGIKGGSILKCDDFLQVYNLNIIVQHVQKLEQEQEFQVVGDISEVMATAEQETQVTPNGASTSAATNNQDDEDELMMMEDEDVVAMEDAANAAILKRKRRAPSAEDADIESVAKRKKLDSNEPTVVSDDDIVML